MGCGSWDTRSFVSYSTSKGYDTDSRGIVTGSYSNQEMFKAKNIDVFKPGIWYNYNIFKISPVLLYHNVEQCGYRIIIDNKKCIYWADRSRNCKKT